MAGRRRGCGWTALSAVIARIMGRRDVIERTPAYLPRLAPEKK